MAQIVLTDAVITINSVALSDRANSVELNYEVDSVEVTAFGATGHAFTGGLQNVTLKRRSTRWSARRQLLSSSRQATQLVLLILSTPLQVRF